MSINKDKVILVLAAIAVYNECVAAVNGRRANANKRKYDALRDYTNLLVDRLNHEGIQLTEFEKIVMNDTLENLKK